MKQWEKQKQFCNNKTVYHSGSYILLPVFGKKAMIKNWKIKGKTLFTLSVSLD